MDASGSRFALQVPRCISSREMKPTRFSIRGNDHPDRQSVVLSRPDFTDVDGDQFLSGHDRTFDRAPILEDVDFERGRIAYRIHVKNVQSIRGRRQDLKNTEETECGQQCHPAAEGIFGLRYRTDLEPLGYGRFAMVWVWEHLIQFLFCLLMFQWYVRLGY